MVLGNAIRMLLLLWHGKRCLVESIDRLTIDDYGCGPLLLILYIHPPRVA
jgi:hypothetical protein